MIQPKKKLLKKSINTYKDSLQLYEQNDKLLKQVHKNPNRYMHQFRKIDESNNNKTIVIDDAVNDDFEPINKNIKPIGYTKFSNTVNNPKEGGKDLKVNILVPKYKKPTGKINSITTQSNIKQDNEDVKRKSLPITKSVSILKPKEIEQDNNIKTDVNIISNYIKPKSYKIIEERVAPYGLGKRDDQVNTTTYEVEDGNNIDLSTIKNRKITPKYASGGKIDPPIKSKGLSPEQQKEAEEDVTFTNNWNANRIVKGKKLPKGYQIPSNQPVILEDLNINRKEGEGITRGQYENGIIKLDPSFQEEYGIPAHEYAHKFQDKTKLMRPKIYNKYIKNPIETLAPNQETYQSDPNEIHSELMRLRRNANFKPDQVITPEDVQNLDFNNYNFNAVKDKDTLIELLNSTADINKSSIPIAKYGIELNNKNQSDMNTNYIKPREIKKVPKAFIGAAIAGISAISGMVQANQQKKAVEAANKLSLQNNLNTAEQEQDIYNNQFIQDNINDLPVYDIGGKINTNQFSTTGKYDTVGGELIPISSNAEVVDGNTHKENKIDNSYGVTLSENGEPVANVEDKEVVVDNDLVFSDKLKTNGKTFADIAFKINKKIGDLEIKNKQLIKANEKFANERTIIGLKKANEDLFAKQELVKENTYGKGQETIDVVDGKVPIARRGIRLDNPDVDAEILNNSDSNSFINGEELSNLGVLAVDNISNAIITDNAPEISAPIYRRPTIYSTTVNANPQLASINQTIGNSNEIIRANTNNSAVARANMTANNLRGIEATNNVYSQKQDIERQLLDKQNAEITRVGNINTELNEDYQADVRESSLQKNSAYSKNVQNLMEDYQAVKENSLQKQYDDDVISYSLLDDPTGAKRQVFDRFGRPLSKSAQARIDREKLRMQQFNTNKNI